ncbi:6473_t:CDS:2, partial [Racocetra persica]
GESAQDAKRYLMKEIIVNYCQKVSSLNYDSFSPEMGVVGGFLANENDKKIAVIKTLLDNHQKLKEFGSAPKKESDSDLVEVVREVYQEKSTIIDNSIQQLEDELIILNISNQGSRERIMRLVKQSRENKIDSSTDVDAKEIEQNRLEMLEGENSQLQELLRKAEVEKERDAKWQEKQISKLEKDHEKDLKEANQRATEALAQLEENKENLTNLRKEAAAKEREIANLQDDRERLEKEIIEKNEKIE